MYEVKKIDVLSAAKINGFIAVAGYSIWAVFASVFIIGLGGYASRNFFDFNFSSFSILAILVGFVVSGIAGFGTGAIGALIYNLVSSWIGGIKVHLTLTSDEEEEQE